MIRKHRRGRNERLLVVAEVRWNPRWHNHSPPRSILPSYLGDGNYRTS